MRSVAITDVSRGIGYETARLAIRNGARVFGSVRRPDDARRLEAQFGERFTPLLFDVRDERTVAAEAERVRGLLSGRTLSGLVNNAVLALPGPLLHQPVEEVRAQLDTDLLGPFIVTRAFLPLLGADRSLAGAPGRVVNMSSVGGRIGYPFATAYIASKHGLEGFSDALRRELRLYGIAVIVVAPSVVRTPVWDEVERRIGQYEGTDLGAACDRAIIDIVRAGRDHSLAPQKVARTVWEALTAERPRLRYAPAERPLLEQGLPTALPRRVLDWVLGRRLGLDPGVRGRRRSSQGGLE